MRTGVVWISVLLVVAGVLLYAWQRTDRQSVSAEAPQSTHEADSATRLAPHRSAGERRQGPAPRLSAERPRVTFDRGPARPGEHFTRVRDRTYFVERFDEFVRQSGVTEEQVQAILLALYDYQVQRRALDRDLFLGYVAYQISDEELSESDLAMEYYDQLTQALDRTLDRRQRWLWSRSCGRCYSRLTSPKHEPILTLGQPEDS
jgi:hypothetical protein